VRVLADWAGRAGIEDQLPNRGVQSVGAQHEVEAVNEAVAEVTATPSTLRVSACGLCPHLIGTSPIPASST
jgi:hypothetical protein